MFSKQSNWEYHVNKGNYYGTNNDNGDFEIGWGVGLDNSYDSRNYKIEYKVENAIAALEARKELLAHRGPVANDKIIKKIERKVRALKS